MNVQYTKQWFQVSANAIIFFINTFTLNVLKRIDTYYSNAYIYINREHAAV
jgi:hypothetical protein